jgi:regulator of protease activity HflC (stomatin/prohibitin superfamily)
MLDDFDAKEKAKISKILKIIGFSLIGLSVLILILWSVYFIAPGTRGVVITMGSVGKEVRGEGVTFAVPIIQTIKRIDVKVQKAQTEADASSKDLQQTHSTIALNYHLDPSKVNILYQHIGTEFKDRIIDPTVQEVLKAVTARYAAVDLIQKREIVSLETKQHLKDRLLAYYIIVDDFSIINFRFSKNFTDSVEAKQTAEQLALKARNDLERIKTEAEQTIASAKAEAESLRLRKENTTPLLVQLAAIQKWDGKLPKVTGGAIPFIDINELKPIPVEKKVEIKK